MPHIHEKIDYTVACMIIHREYEGDTRPPLRYNRKFGDPFEEFKIKRTRVLLCKHKLLKAWLPIGGHVELDEDTDQALYREIQEECGLDVYIRGSYSHDRYNEFVHKKSNGGRKMLLIPFAMDIHSLNDPKAVGHRHIGLIYMGESDSDQFVVAEKEHDELRWFTWDELQILDEIDPFVKMYAERAIDQYDDSDAVADRCTCG